MRLESDWTHFQGFISDQDTQLARCHDVKLLLRDKFIEHEKIGVTQ